MSQGLSRSESSLRLAGLFLNRWFDGVCCDPFGLLVILDVIFVLLGSVWCVRAAAILLMLSLVTGLKQVTATF